MFVRIPERNKKYSRIQLIRVNWEDETSGYAENPDNWIFPRKWSTLAV
jgi:hypothetical protein